MISSILIFSETTVRAYIVLYTVSQKFALENLETMVFKS